MNDHMHIGALESAALAPSDFERFAARCEKLCARHLHAGHDGKPSFDGDQEKDGYSLDWLHEQFEAKARPLDVLHRLDARLIVAAPTLLEAAWSAIELINQPGGAGVIAGKV